MAWIPPPCTHTALLGPACRACPRAVGKPSQARNHTVMLAQSSHHPIRQISRLRPREGNWLFQGAQQVGLLTPRQCPSLYTAPPPPHCLLKQWYPIHSSLTHSFIVKHLPWAWPWDEHWAMISTRHQTLLLWPSQLSLPVAPKTPPPFNPTQ